MTGGPWPLTHVEPRVWARGLLKSCLALEQFSALESIPEDFSNWQSLRRPATRRDLCSWLAEPEAGIWCVWITKEVLQENGAGVRKTGWAGGGKKLSRDVPPAIVNPQLTPWVPGAQSVPVTRLASQGGKGCQHHVIPGTSVIPGGMGARLWAPSLQGGSCLARAVLWSQKPQQLRGNGPFRLGANSISVLQGPRAFQVA